MTEPTLDLFGQHTRTPHRPQLAGCAAGMLAAASLLLATVLAFQSYLPLMGSRNLWTMLRFQIALALVSSTLQIAGIMMLWIADMGRGMNPWPQRIMAGAGVIAGSLAVMAYSLFLLQPDPRVHIYSFSDFYSRVYWPLVLASLFFAIIAWSFALLYALLLARWLSSRRLAAWSSAVIGLQLGVLMAYGGLRVISWGSGWPWRFPGLEIGAFVSALRIAAALAVAGYMLIVAMWLLREQGDRAHV
jgi:hypothetical protein